MECGQRDIEGIAEFEKGDAIAMAAPEVEDLDLKSARMARVRRVLASRACRSRLHEGAGSFVCVFV